MAVRALKTGGAISAAIQRAYETGQDDIAARLVAISHLLRDDAGSSSDHDLPRADQCPSVA